MVHHNPGEAPFDTRFTDPVELKARGYNAQCFKHLNTVLRLEGEDAPAPSAEEAAWLDRFTEDRVAEIRAAKAAGLAVFYHIDLFVLPERIVAARRDALCDANGRLSLRKPATLELHRKLLDELFARFPEVDGLIPRVGETYLYDTPFHTGNGAVRYQGAEHDPIRPEEVDDFVTLLRFLREEVCAKHGRWLIHRTWDTRPDRFHANPEFYLGVTEQIEPHDKLLFSIKHTQTDFQRHTAWNPCLGLGRHRQIVEVQCQREYEGKGAYPNYSTLGVIEGFPESNPGRGLAAFTDDPKFAGIYSWSRGGGWYGPKVTKANEFWCDLNVSVLAGFVREPDLGEAGHFERFCQRHGIAGEDRDRLRRIALDSLEAVRAGKCCTAWDTRPGSEGDNFPTNMWMRDDVLGGWTHLEPVFEYLRATDQNEAALNEKDEAVRLWADLETLALSLSADAPAGHREVVISSCAYGHRLFAFVASAWRTLYLDYARRQGDDIAKSDIQQSLQQTQSAWAHYQQMPKDHPSASTLYEDHAWHWPQDPAPDGIGAALGDVANRR
jgi:hypothetical protein